MNQRSHLQLQTAGVSLTDTEGGEDKRLLTDASLTENWRIGLCSNLSFCSLTLIMSQFAWQNTIGNRLLDKTPLENLTKASVRFAMEDIYLIYLSFYLSIYIYINKSTITKPHLQLFQVGRLYIFLLTVETAYQGIWRRKWSFLSSIIHIFDRNNFFERK